MIRSESSSSIAAAGASISVSLEDLMAERARDRSFLVGADEIRDDFSKPSRCLLGIIVQIHGEGQRQQGRLTDPILKNRDCISLNHGIRQISRATSGSWPGPQAVMEAMRARI